MTDIIDFQFYQPNYGSGSGGGTRPTRLRQLQLPATVQYVLPGACAGIETLLKVNIPDGCSVGRDAFAGCGIEELTLGENTCLDMDCFRGTRVQSVDLPMSTEWNEYGDFGGHGICGHFVSEEQGKSICPIIFDVFGDTPWEARVRPEWERLLQQQWEEEKPLLQPRHQNLSTSTMTTCRRCLIKTHYFHYKRQRNLPFAVFGCVFSRFDE